MLTADMTAREAVMACLAKLYSIYEQEPAYSARALVIFYAMETIRRDLLGEP